VCRPLTICPPGQIEFEPPTFHGSCNGDPANCVGAIYTADRACKCSGGPAAGQYVYSEATDSVPQLCRTHTQCTVAEYQSEAPSSSSDRSCSALTPCGADEYESASATPTTDRECKALATCHSEEYESQPPTSTSDRGCSAVTLCGAEQYQTVAAVDSYGDTECHSLSPPCEESHSYESQAPTTTSDRVCAPLTSCLPGSNTYESVVATYSSARVCAPCTVCGADEFETTACTPTSNRQCAPVTVCSPNEYQSACPTATSNAECSDITACNADEYELEAPTFSSDRICAPLRVCQCAAFDDPSCEYESVAPTTTSNRECALQPICQHGLEYEFVAPGPNNPVRQCKPLTLCTSLQYESQPPQLVVTPSGTSKHVSDRVCSDMTVCNWPGTETSSQYQDVAPQLDYFNSRYISNRQCVDNVVCSLADDNEYELYPPTYTTPRVCADAGTCTDDQYVIAAATPTSAAVCGTTTQCSADQWECQAASSSSDRHCCPISPSCTAPHYFECASCAPTVNSDRVCLPTTACATGSYEASADGTCSSHVWVGAEFQDVAPTPTSDRVCKPWTSCSASEWESSTGSILADRVCQPLTTSNTTSSNLRHLHASQTGTARRTASVRTRNTRRKVLQPLATVNAPTLLPLKLTVMQTDRRMPCRRTSSSHRL
jgi:hypothetical protein